MGESVDTHFASACHFYLGKQVLIHPWEIQGKEILLMKLTDNLMSVLMYTDVAERRDVWIN